jgi:hypothetical protein
MRINGKDKMSAEDWLTQDEDSLFNDFGFPRMTKGLHFDHDDDDDDDDDSESKPCYDTGRSVSDPF